MSDIVVEVHVPLTVPADLVDDEERFPWIADVMDFVSGLEDVDVDGVMMHDDAEEVDEHYVFFITGAAESALIRVATTIAHRPGVPIGTFAMITDSDASAFGLGTRVELD